MRTLPSMVCEPCPGGRSSATARDTAPRSGSTPSSGASGPAYREHGLLFDTMTVVHGNGLGDDELRMIADAGGSVSISPDVEVKMGFGWPMTGRMLAAGLRPTLSIDDCPSAGGDMFSTMRTAYAVQRGLDGGLNSRELLEFAIVDGARACGLDARTGSITPGKDADIVLLRADDPTVFPVTDAAGTIVSAGHPGLVDTVLVAGGTGNWWGWTCRLCRPGCWIRATGSRPLPASRSTGPGARAGHRSRR